VTYPLRKQKTLTTIQKLSHTPLHYTNLFLNNTTYQYSNQINQLRQQYQTKKRSIRTSRPHRVAINIISNNINGLQLQTPQRRLQAIYSKMFDNNIDILLIQEINTNIKHYQFTRELHNLHQQYQHTQSVWSQLPFSNSTVYQPGGVAIIVRFPLSKHISH
jgi:hypothetical protein